MVEYEQPVQASSFGFQTNSMGYHTESIMRYRLDMAELLRDIELYLSGKRIEMAEDSEGIRENLIQYGEPLMNRRGIQSIIGSLRLLLGPHTVQGNLEKDAYDNLVEEINIYLARDIMINRVYWEVRLEDFPMIVDTIVWTTLLFLSRIIDNKERESYASTVRSIDTTNVKEKSKGVLSSVFGGG